MKALFSILLLIVSNVFMTLAWYGHLQLKKTSLILKWGLFGVVVISWGVAFFEYMFQVPANRLGYRETGGPFNLVELKLIQEVISLFVFSFFSIMIFKTDKFNWNYVVAFICIILAVFFVFKGKNS